MSAVVVDVVEGDDVVVGVVESPSPEVGKQALNIKVLNAISTNDIK